MCLFFGSQALSTDPAFKPNQQCRTLQQNLQILSLIHFTLALVLLFFGGRLMSVVTPLILFAGAMTLQYPCLMFYMLYGLFDIIITLEPVGLALQQMTTTGSSPSISMLPFLLMLCFLAASIHYVFGAYKVFKVCDFEAKGISFEGSEAQ